MSDVVQSCPMPQIAEALQPYIRSRQEVVAIRQALHATLPLTPVSIAQPHLEAIAERTPNDSLRRAYVRALQVHNDAQTRYDALKADLAKINSRTEDASSKDNFLAEHYLPLVQQREKQRKLGVLDRTLDRIADIGGDSISDSFDNVIKAELGDLPSPPTQSLFADRETASDAEVKIGKLKKAILYAKQSIDEHRRKTAALAEINLQDIDPQVEVLALQDTHNALTTWMESQLKLIGEITGSNGDNSSLNSPGLPPGAGHQARNDIEDLYEQYLDAREKLLENITRPSTSLETAHANMDTGLPLDGERKDRTTPSEILLPYLTQLLSARQQEQDLFQQSSFLKQRLSEAEARNQDVLARLADESHLLQNHVRRGLARGPDWSRASGEANDAGEKFIKEKLNVAIAATTAAEDKLSAIKGTPEMLA